MKKIRFAAQIFILAASFPVLFISGINTPGKRSSPQEIRVNDSPAIRKSIQKEDRVCNNDKAQKMLMVDMLLKN